MKVLALDTTTRAGSAALVEDDRVVDQRCGDGTLTHALRMPAEVLTLAAANGWPLGAIDLYAVASGPGSFTGLRIGIATIQGLALVHRRRVVAVPVLDALAHAAAADVPANTVVAAWMDAHRGEVFAGLYRVVSPSGSSLASLVTIEEPTVGSPGSTLERWRTVGSLPAVISGDGATLHAAQIGDGIPSARVLAEPLLAGIIGRLAHARASEALDPKSVRPLYVRRPAVEVARDEKLRRGNPRDIGH